MPLPRGRGIKVFCVVSVLYESELIFSRLLVRVFSIVARGLVFSGEDED